MGKKYERSKQAKWDRRHLCTVGTHVDPVTKDEFRWYCRKAGVTPYGILRKFIYNWVEQMRLREEMERAKNGDGTVWA